MANFKTLPGFRDFFPEELAERQFIFQVWRQAAARFGFQEFDGPVLESLDLYKAKSGDEIERQLFSFTDKGGRDISLRPEMTPTLGRMVAAKANALKRPIKWFSIGDHFRYERMQRGRLRCFSQLNADILGEAGPSADVEAIALLVQILQTFGLGADDFYIRLSDRRLWVFYLSSLGYKESETSAILEIVDKWERLEEEKLRENLSAIVGTRADSLWNAVDAFIEIDSISSLRAVFDQSASSPESTALEARLEEWNALIDGLECMELGSFLKIDLGVVRGLAYYTGFVFEAFDKSKAFRALAGGGRYDTLIRKVGGPEMPAVGFGMGDVVLADLLRERELMPQFVNTIDIFAVLGGPEERSIALRDIAMLRQAGYGVDYSFRTQAIGKQFKAANSSGARLALIYGSDEMAKGVVKARNLNDRSEVEIPRAKLLVAVTELLGA